MNLPALVVLTDATATGGRPLAAVIEGAVEGGARAVVLREKHLPRLERVALADQLRPILDAAGGRFLVASDPTIPADGVHLSATDPYPDGAALVGRSCHSAADVERAAAEGCDYTFLSPIYLTRSKPGYGPALGPDALGALALPTWALGGIEPENAASCVAAGAAGVAVMGAVMRAGDPAATVRALLAAVAPTVPAAGATTNSGPRR